MTSMPVQPRSAISGNSIGLGPAFSPPSSRLVSMVISWPEPERAVNLLPPAYRIVANFSLAIAILLHANNIPPTHSAYSCIVARLFTTSLYRPITKRSHVLLSLAAWGAHGTMWVVCGYVRWFGRARRQVWLTWA